MDSRIENERAIWGAARANNYRFSFGGGVRFLAGSAYLSFERAAIKQILQRR